MSLKRLLLTSAFALAVAPLSAAGQSEQISIVPSKPTDPPGPRVIIAHPATAEDTPYSSTRSFSGKVYEINLDEGYIVVTDPKRGTGKFFLSDKTRLRADKETPLGDRKNLTLEDFKEGQTVKVTFWPRGSKATEVRVRQPKS